MPQMKNAPAGGKKRHRIEEKEVSEADADIMVHTDGAEPVTEEKVTDSMRELMDSADARQVLRGKGRGSRLGTRLGAMQGRADTDLETDQQLDLDFINFIIYSIEVNLDVGICFCQKHLNSA